MVTVTNQNQTLNDKQIRRERRRQKRERETLAATNKIMEITANGFSDIFSYDGIIPWYDNETENNTRNIMCKENSLLYDVNRTNECKNIYENKITPCGIMRQQIQLCDSSTINDKPNDDSSVDFTVTREYTVKETLIPVNTTSSTIDQQTKPRSEPSHKQKRHSNSTESSPPVKKFLVTRKNSHSEILANTKITPDALTIDQLVHAYDQTQPIDSSAKPIFPASNFKSTSTTRHQVPQIIHYVRQGKYKLLERYLAEHPDTNINATDERERTALHYAAMLRNEKMVMMLLNHSDIDINLRDKYRKTPLRYAVESNSLDCVERLVENGANPTHVAKDGLTPFEYALHYHGDNAFYVISYLLQKYGADKTRLSCLHRLALDYHELPASQIAEELILLGADVNAIDGNGKTPLMYAVERKNDALIRVLVEQRSNLFHEDDNEKHIFNYAAAAGMKYAAMFQKELLKHLYKQ